MNSSSPATDPEHSFFVFSSSPNSHLIPISSSSPSWSEGSDSDTTVTSEEPESGDGNEDCSGVTANEHPSGLRELLVEAADACRLREQEEADGNLESGVVVDASESVAALSPLVFASRVIHRASSYQARTRTRRKTSISYEHKHEPGSACEREGEPPLKRPKILTRTSTHTKLRTRLACAPASLRRAASLRSGKDIEEGNKENIIPIIPSSPANLSTKSGANGDVGLPGVPIIAPPDPLPRYIVSDRASEARARIRRFVERERELRVAEGYGYDDEQDERNGRWRWEVIGNGLREDVVRWFLEVVPPSHVDVEAIESKERDESCSIGSSSASSRHGSSESSCSTTSSTTTIYSFKSSSTSTSTSATSASTSTSSTSVSSSTSISTATSTSTSTLTATSTYTSTSTSTSTPQITSSSHTASASSPHPTNLHCQLANSPETRFHAAYMFLRFFRIVGGDGSVTSPIPKPAASRETMPLSTSTPIYSRDPDADWAHWYHWQTPGPGEAQGEIDNVENPEGQWAHELDDEGKLLVTWDVAIACLAVSVKYHRDFLYPLFPVYAHEFMRLETGLRERRYADADADAGLGGGPDIGTRAIEDLGEMDVGYEDLEIAHRDLLAALDFRLGDTPQGILNEALEAMPQLRRVVRGLGSGLVGSESADTDVGAGEGVDAGWNLVLRETWKVLFRAILAPTILTHPLSELTASALLYALCVLLTKRYEDAQPWYTYELCRNGPAPTPSCGSGCASRRGWRDRDRDTAEREARMKRAERKIRTSGVLCEVLEVIGVEEERLERCRTWLKRICAETDADAELDVGKM